MENTIQTLLITQLPLLGMKTALVYKNHKLSYAELFKQAQAIAYQLLTKNITRNKIVGILIKNPINRIITTVGIILAGAAYCPLDPTYPKKRLQYMYKSIGYSCIITDIDLKEKNVIKIENLLSNETDPASSIFLASAENDLIYVLFTSGSTGKPKAAALIHRGIFNLLKWYTNQFKINKQDKILILSSFSFDLTHKNLLAGIISGAEIHIFEPNQFIPEQIINYIEQEKPSIINCTPSIFYSVVEHAKDITQLSSFRYIILGGEKINLALLRNLSMLYPQTKLVNTYGPTECSDITCFHVFSQHEVSEKNAAPLGSTIPGVEINILNENFKSSNQGELFISGVSLGNGYLNDEKLTNEKFIYLEGEKLAYKTGDYVKKTEQNELIFIGRKDHQIKLRGLRIELDEIQENILQLPEIKFCCVLSEKINGIHYLIAAIALKKKLNNPQQYISEKLKKNLPGYMIPSIIFTIDIIPLTPNGKIDKQAISNLLKKHQSKIPSQDNPSYTKIENEIIFLMSRILEIPINKIKRNSNFYDLGGYSIYAIELLSEINNQYQISLDLHDFIGNETPEALSNLIFLHQKKITKNLSDSNKKKINIYEPNSFQINLLNFIKKNETSIALNLPIAFEINGPFNITLFKKATYKIIIRHPMLRAIFLNKNRIEIMPENIINVDMFFDYVCSHSAPTENEIHQFISFNFNPKTLPLFKIRIYKKEDNKYLLLFVFSHLIMDGFSWNIFIQDLISLYHNTEKSIKILELPQHSFRNQKLTNEFNQKILKNLNLKYFPKNCKNFFYAKQIYRELNCLKSTQNIFSLLKKNRPLSLFSSLLNIVLHKYKIKDPVVFPTSPRAVYNPEQTIIPISNIHPVLQISMDDKKTLANQIEFFNNYFSFLEKFKEISLRDIIKNFQPSIMLAVQFKQKIFNKIGQALFNYYPLTTRNINYKLQLHIWPMSENKLLIQLIYNIFLLNTKTAENIMNDFYNLLINLESLLNNTLLEVTEWIK